jgi:hypothetical protein
VRVLKDWAVASVAANITENAKAHRQTRERSRNLDIGVNERSVENKCEVQGFFGPKGRYNKKITQGSHGCNNNVYHFWNVPGEFIDASYRQKPRDD